MPIRSDTSRRRSALGLAAGLAADGVLLLIDLALRPDHVPVGLFVVGPLIAATLATAVPTAVVAAVSILLAFAIGVADDLDSTELLWRWTTVVIGGALALLLADQRRRRLAAAEAAQEALIEELQVRQKDEVLATTRKLVARLEDAQRVGRMGSWEHDLATGRIEWSDGMAHLVGTEAGSITSRSDAGAYIHPEEHDRLTAIYGTVMATGAPFEYAQRMVHRNGHELLTMVVGEGVRDDEGRLIGLRGITRDVTEERKAAERLDQMRRQLVESDRVVDALQRAMLPQVLATDARVEIVAVYRSVDERAEIGGDWYDAFRVDGDLGLSIGDVAGHGLGATSLMAHARLALRWEGFTGSDPGAALARVDRMLETETGGRTFATAIFGRYRLDEGTLRWSRAGHCPPVVLTGAGAVSVESCGGPPLAAGLGPEKYDEAELTLQPGDTVFLYTDGLVERRRRPFDAGLRQLLTVLETDGRGELAPFVASLPDRLCDVGPLEDDCCIVALRRVR